MKSTKITTMVALVLAAGAAGAAVVSGTGTINLYGTSYPVTQWRTLSDAGTTGFDPESLTFYNGTLYASADEGSSAGNGRLVSYIPGATGDLTASTFVTMGNNGGSRWGGEGLTVNTSGAGYGSFGPGGLKFVSVDSRGSNATGAVINFDDGGSPKPLSGITALPESDDVAWVGERNQFGLLLDVDGSIGWFNNALVATGTSTPTFEGAKGITVVSSAWVQRVFGFSALTTQAVVVVGKETNRLGIFDTQGNALGSVQSLLPAGVSFSEIEAVAIDELNDKIYLADEAALSIHVVSVPSPASLALLGLAFAGRRRSRK